MKKIDFKMLPTLVSHHGAAHDKPDEQNGACVFGKENRLTCDTPQKLGKDHEEERYEDKARCIGKECLSYLLHFTISRPAVRI
jgi:hypothetical protein